MTDYGNLSKNTGQVHASVLPKLYGEAFQSAHARLGGSTGFLGKPVGEIQACPDGVGLYQHYQGGSLYWHKDEIHEVHGAIREKWGALGWERSFLGYPITDETATPDGAGRFSHFQGGSIYWSPETGAWEIHGAIREKWAELGWERSSLGYPISDESDFPEDGKVSFFERGAIYWWPDSGALALDDVAVKYTGIVCYGETDNDQLSDSDEPYVVLGVIEPNGTAAFRSQVYEGVDGGDSRPDLIEIYRGKPRGLTISVLLMEHDDGDPDKYKTAMQSSVGAAFTGVTALIAIIPVVGPVIAGIVGPILAAVTPTVGEELNRLLDTGDDRIGETTIAITPKQMVQLAAQTPDSQEKRVRYKLATPLLSAHGASYKAFFGIDPVEA